ncbi:immunoglobulin-like and fibronectin type III domain containing 1, partial [Chelydra serpentina]
FLRVRAINEGGLGEAVALDTCIQAMPPIVSPKFLRDDTMKNIMIIKVGSCIRVPIPFEASPTPEAIWLKDGLPLPSRAIVSTTDGLSQLLIPSAEFSDSGLYTIILQNEWGKKESFSFQVQVTDIPQSPGPILLQEKVPNTVTVIWEPSPTEKWESNLYYVVMKRDSNKGSWQVVGDLIYNNKFTITKLIPGRGYCFRVVAKNYMGTSDPSETVQPWIMQKEKDEFKVRLPKYRRVNQNMPPRFLVLLKPHVVTTAFDCHMSCAVSGYPKPKITWYKDGRNLSEDPTFFSTNDFGVCCLVIPGVTRRDEGEY